MHVYMLANHHMQYSAIDIYTMYGQSYNYSGSVDPTNTDLRMILWCLYV